MTIEIANLIIEGSIGIAAFVALLQIKQSRDSFRLNSKRESVKYASELVKEYLNEIIVLINDSDDSLRKIGYKKYEGEFSLKSFSTTEINEEKNIKLKEHFIYESMLIDTDSDDKNSAFRKMLNEANAIESFATPFVARVADEKIAFNTVGLTFCNIIQSHFYLYVLVRGNHNEDENNFFSNTITLYNIWQDRINKSKLKNVIKRTQETLRSMSQDKEEIIPFGTE